MYTALKHLHILFAVVSVTGFVARGVLALMGSSLLQRPLLRRLPHINDTLLFAAGVALAVLTHRVPFVDVWITAKLAAVLLYIVLPVIIAQIWRKRLLARGKAALQRTLEVLGPLSISALLLTLVLLFAFQGEAIVEQPLIIAMLAVPITIQVYFNSALAYWLNRRAGEAHCVAGPSALIGASNFFELAVAAAISLFGFQSGAALATVVGVLIEVPVMLSVVYLVRRSQNWYEQPDKA